METWSFFLSTWLRKFVIYLQDLKVFRPLGLSANAEIALGPRIKTVKVKKEGTKLHFRSLVFRFFSDTFTKQKFYVVIIENTLVDGRKET